jgi:hypothetical protein
MAGAEAATANRVLSTKLTGHVTDIETADKVAEMVDTVLKVKRPLRMEYRCDSPEEVRRFRLTIQPLKDDRALMVHDLHDAMRLDTPMEPWSFDPSGKEVKCSMCSRVHLPIGWTDPADLSFPHPQRVRYGMCPQCTTRADTAIRAVVTGDGVDEIPIFVPKSGIIPE